MSLSFESATSPAPATQSATGRLPTTDNSSPSQGLKPEAAKALVRARDKLVEQIRLEIKTLPDRSIQGSLYVLLIAICVNRTTTLKRLAEFRDLYNMIRGNGITTVRQLATALPVDVLLDEVICADPETKPAVEVMKMLGTVAKLRGLVNQLDTGNLEFYDRLKGEIEEGKITSFGQLCDRLPTFLVDLDSDMRRARNSFRDERDAQRNIIVNFQAKAAAEIKEELTFTKRGTLKHVFLRVLQSMIGDFAEPELMNAWTTLRDSARSDQYTSIGSFLASVPDQLRHKANELTASAIK